MGIIASNQASEREVSYEPSTSHFNGWSTGGDRGRAAGAGGCGGRDVDCAAYGGRPAGLAGCVGLPDHHPDGATRRARNEGVFYRRGGGNLREGRKSTAGSRSDRSGGGWFDVPAGRRRPLQRVLVRPGQQGRGDTAHVADRGPAQWPTSGDDAGWEKASGSPRGGAARDSAGASPRRFVGRPAATGALHCRAERWTANASRRLQ